MTKRGVSAVVFALMAVVFWIGACAPAVATPSQNSTASGTPTYDESLSLADGSVIGERRPTISWTLYPNGQEVAAFRMTLDGRDVVPVKKQKGLGIVFEYQPAADLQPGSHTVIVMVTFKGYQPLALSSQFTVTNNPVNPFEGKDRTQLAAMEAEAVTHLNTIRKSLGLNELVINNALTLAAQSHSNFLQMNQLIGHYQNKNYPGFTGVAPQDRAAFFGYGGTASEGIDYGTASPRMSVEGLLDAPYHRLGLINPNDREVGAGFSIASYNMVISPGTTGARDDARVMLYPMPGQTGVKSSWYVAESPNPLAFYKKDRIYVGYPISLSLHDSKTREVRYIASSIKDSSGQQVAHFVTDSAKEDESKKHVFLIPHAPLQSGMTYQVRIEAERILTDGGVQPIVREWSFTTRSTLAIDYLGLVKLNGVDNLELKVKNGDMRDLSYVMIYNGEFVRKYSTTQGYSWTSANPLAGGTYRLQVACPSVSSDLMEYTVQISMADGKRNASVTNEVNLGKPPAVQAGLLRLGGREHIELFWRGEKPGGVSYVLKRGNEGYRSYRDNMYYAQRGLTLANGQYTLEISQANSPEPQRYLVKLSGDEDNRQVSLSPLQ